MSFTTREREMILTRLSVIGVPPEVSKPFVSTIEKWIVSSGKEWTIARLKSICTDLIRKRAGQGPSSSWIRKNPKGCRWFTGAVGGLESWGFKGNNFPKMIQALRIYTNFYAGEVTPLQSNKFLSGVTSTPVDVSSFRQIISDGVRASRISTSKLVKARPLLSRPPSDTRAPTINGSMPEMEGLVDSVAFLHLDGKRHYHRYSSLYDPVLQGLEPEILCNITCPRWLEDSEIYGEVIVGKIGIIQEPGFKLRAVANPGRVFQRVLEPLGSHLFSILADLPWDCTFDQSKADSHILRCLDNEDFVYSVDLSGATDYFPLSLQIMVLNQILPQDQLTIEMFRELSTSWWLIDPTVVSVSGIETDFPEGFVRWTKGQPLGLYPSFASFALTHGILLLGLLGRSWNGEFFVLGDDVVILDTDLYEKYRVALELLGCPVSESKTLVSNTLSEFRSRIYEKGALRSFPQLKWRHPSDDSFLDIVRLLGLAGLRLLDRRQYRVARIVASIPDFAGGLGFNPEGLPLSERLDPWITLLLKDYFPVDRLTDYSGLVTERLYKSSLSQLAYSGLVMSVRRDMSFLDRDLDQRSYSLVESTLGPLLAPWWRILGRNLDLVLEGDLDLLIPGLPARQTNLQKWETLLTTVLGDRWRNPCA